MDSHTFQQLLQELKDIGGIRVCGSYARGTQHAASDLDLYLAPDPSSVENSDPKRRINRVIAAIRRHGVTVESVSIGCIHTPRNLDAMPIPIEASYWFKPTEGRLPEVSICGVTFRTF